MRLLLASGCLPERAGQPAQIQLHLTLDELLGMPGAADAARTWLARHLGTDPADHQDASSQEGGSYPGDSSQPGGTTSSAAPADHPGTSQPDGTTSSAASADYPGTSQPGGSGQPGEAQAGASASGAAPGEAQPGAPGGGSSGSGNPDLDELLWPDPFRTFSKPIPAAIRRAGGAGQAGWLTGKAAEAYACDAKIAPMVCGHLDRNLLARAVTDFLAGDLANLVTSSDPLPAPRPRCECDEHPARRRAPIPGALPITAPPAAPTDPVTPGLTAVGAPSGTVRRLSPTPGGLARLQDTLLRYAVSLLSGPTGLAAYPADPAHRRVLPRRQPAAGSGPADRGSTAAPAPGRDQAGPALLIPRLLAATRPLSHPPHHPQIQRWPHAPRQPHAALRLSSPDRDPPPGLVADPARRRDHHGQEPRRDQDLAQPRAATRPGHAVA